MAEPKTAQEELIEVEQALSSIALGGQSYTIGSRKLTRADYSALLARKKELTREDIDAINSRIDYLMNKAGVDEVTARGQYVKIVNERTPQEAADAILGVIYAAQHNKNRKRIL